MEDGGVKIGIRADWQSAGGGSRGYEVTFEESDLTDLQKQKGLTRGQAISQLSLQGERLVLAYVRSQGAIGAETYRARDEELRGQSDAS